MHSDIGYENDLFDILNSFIDIDTIDNKKIKKQIRKYVLSLLELYPNCSNEKMYIQLLLVAYTYYLDRYLDENDFISRVNSEKLFTKIYELIDVNFGSQVKKDFERYLERYKEYLMCEKQTQTAEYEKRYMKEGRIDKAIILLFVNNILIKNKNKDFENFISIMLLLDDIVDYEDDLKKGIITYIIIKKQKNDMDDVKNLYDKLCFELENTQSVTIQKELTGIKKYVEKHKIM